jgi:hypothetical protein
MQEPRVTLDDSIIHVRTTFRAEYPKTPKRCSVGNLSEKLHDEYMQFCEENSLGQAEALASLLDFAYQHAATYEKELAALKKQTKRRA